MHHTTYVSLFRVLLVLNLQANYENSGNIRQFHFSHFQTHKNAAYKLIHCLLLLENAQRRTKRMTTGLFNIHDDRRLVLPNLFHVSYRSDSGDLILISKRFSNFLLLPSFPKEI
jgi:hypothetical protein